MQVVRMYMTQLQRDVTSDGALAYALHIELHAIHQIRSP